MDALGFADAVILVGAACYDAGIPAPAFVSRAGSRTVRRTESGAVVYVPSVAGRPDVDVLTDMVDGAIAAAGRPDLRDPLLTVVGVTPPEEDSA